MLLLAIVIFGCVAGAFWCLSEEWERGRRIDRDFKRDGLVWRRKR